MIRFFILFCFCTCLFFSQTMNAEENSSQLEGESDYSVDFSLQSYPSNALVNGQLGYGLPFWQSAQNKELFGYVHPSILYSTSILTHAVYGQFEIFPIPFIGFYGGAGGLMSYQDDYQGIDCNQVSCHGNYSEQYIGTKGGVSYSSYFFTFDYYIEKMNHKNKNRQFIEYKTGLIANPKDETMNYLEWAIGATTQDNFSIGVLNVFAKTSKSNNNVDSLYLMGAHQWPDYTGTILVGNYSGNDRKNHLNVILTVTWTGKRGLGFF